MKNFDSMLKMFENAETSEIAVDGNKLMFVKKLAKNLNKVCMAAASDAKKLNFDNATITSKEFYVLAQSFEQIADDLSTSDYDVGASAVDGMDEIVKALEEGFAKISSAFIGHKTLD